MDFAVASKTLHRSGNPDLGGGIKRFLQDDCHQDTVNLMSEPLQFSSYPTFKKFHEFPHACLAWSEDATWGSYESVFASETDVPPSTDILLYSEDGNEEVDFDDDEYVVEGGTIGCVDNPGDLSGGFPSSDRNLPDFPSPQSNPVVLTPPDQPQGPDAEPCEEIGRAHV